MLLWRTERAIARRASRIRDPVKRLRFLRTAAAGSHPAPRGRVLAALGLVLVASFSLMRAVAKIDPITVRLRPPGPALSVAGASATEVWQVEGSKDLETYSNGLRVDCRFSVATHPRSYLVYPAGNPGRSPGERHSEPAGIVFHTTEGQQAAFEEKQNGALKEIGGSLIEYVRRRRAYNYLVDRFGRVYRIVPDSDAANHAGYSVWSDGAWVYVNLNESFLGVSVETRTEPGQVRADITAGQLRAMAMLVEYLRSRYRIAAANCVTHGQVSVNPGNMRLGYHTDWASSFPFAEVGLPDNYAQPLAAVPAFGFEYDSTFLREAGGRVFGEAEAGEEMLRERAADSGVAYGAYRRLVQRWYRERLGRAPEEGE